MDIEDLNNIQSQFFQTCGSIRMGGSRGVYSQVQGCSTSNSRVLLHLGRVNVGITRRRLMEKTSHSSRVNNVTVLGIANERNKSSFNKIRTTNFFVIICTYTYILPFYYLLLRSRRQ